MNTPPNNHRFTLLMIVIAVMSVIFSDQSLAAEITLNDFDLRQSMAADPPDAGELNRQAGQMAAMNRLESNTPGLKIKWNHLLDSPEFIRSTRGFLTSPADPDVAPLQLISDFISDFDDLFQLGDIPLQELIITREGTTVHNGVRTLWLQQTIDGVPILDCDLRANITSDGKIVSIGSRLLNLQNDAVAITRQSISGNDAIRAAAISIGVDSITPPTEILQTINRKAQEYRTKELSGIVRCEERYIPLSPTDIRLGTRVVLQAVGQSDVYEIYVLGDSGQPIIRRRLSHTVIEPATYRVFEKGDPTPFSPGPPFPNGFQPPHDSRSLITIGALDQNASPEGWIPAGVNSTIGNNISAQSDQNFDNIPDIPRPLSDGDRVFDFPFTPGAPPESNLNAAVTQAFYMGNWFHDVMYGYGFTESFGNFQESNFGRGGIDNDALHIDVLDGGGSNNARFISSGNDGSDGRIELYLWSNSEDSRDSAFDNQVLLHELAHGVSVRLHGGLSGIHAGGMSEGWSDFIALSLLANPGDNLAGVYPIGSYLAYTESDPPFLDNYYFGIRRYPYSIDFNVNPLTFADTDPQQFDVGISAPRNPIVSFDNPARVHRVGEIWCQILWECRAEMIQTHGFDGNAMMLRLITDAMKLTTTSEPNMVIGRDAILLADLVNNNGENLCLLWNAFARRGLGTQAASPPTGLSGIVESFESISEPMLRTLTPAPTHLAPGESFPIMITTDPGCAGSEVTAPVELRISVNGGPYLVIQAIAESASIFHTEIPGLLCGDLIDYYFTIGYDTGDVFDPPQGESQPYQAIAEVRQDLGRIRASDRRTFDFFGFTVDIEDDTAVVGAFQHDEAGFDSGAVYVYRVHQSGEWDETAKLTHPTSENLANFGYSVAMNQDILAVGAIGDDLRAHNSGAAYIYNRSSENTWFQQGALTASDGETGDLFGASIDIEGGYTIIGAPGNDTAGNNAGAVYIFARDDTDAWFQEKRILAEDGQSSDSLGKSVSISGNVLALGAPGHSFSAGAVYLYQMEAPGQWAHVTTLVAPETQNGALYGTRVHLNGDQLIVGAINGHDFFQNVGVAYVYKNDPILGWEFQAMLSAPDQRGLDEFGSGVAIENNLAIVGARRSNTIGSDSGAVYSYTRNMDGQWIFESKIIPEEIQPRINLGISVALDQGLSIVGAWTDGVDNSITGSAFLIRPIASDCDGNGIADSCDIASDSLNDANGDGILDHCQCSGDLNGDRLIDTADLGIMINRFGQVDPLADLNLDGLVDQSDLGLLLLNFNLECTPDVD